MNTHNFDKKRLHKNKLLLTFTFVIALLLLGAGPLLAFDFEGRVDTGYDIIIGDNTTDQDLTQHHSIDLFITERLSFEWYGGLRKDLNGKKNEVASDGEEQSDVSTRSLADAVNEDQNLEYRIYSAILKYEAEKYGALIGRSYLYDYEYTTLDGIKLWGQPITWLRVEALVGKPWHYVYSNNYSEYFDSGGITAGAGTDFLISSIGLNIYLRYLFLHEETQRNTLLGEPEDTFLSDDHISKARISYYYADWLMSDLHFAFHDSDAKDLNLWLSGFFDKFLLSYYASYYRQFIDIEDFGDRSTQFSAFLTANNPYQRISLTLTKSLADLFDLTTGFVSGIDLEMGYENRRPNDDGDESQFNPRYNMIRFGTILSTRPKWNFNVFYEAIITKDIENNYHFVGGEVAKKWDKINLHVGSSFIANKFETDSTGVVLEDSFYAQEYYFKVKWLPIKPLDVSLKTTFEVAKFSSFADDPVNGDVTGVGPDTIIEDPRHYLRFDLKVGYSFGSSRD